MTMADTILGIAKKKRRTDLILELSKFENFDEVVASARSKKTRQASAIPDNDKFMDSMADDDDVDIVPWIGVSV